LIKYFRRPALLQKKPPGGFLLLDKCDTHGMMKTGIIHFPEEE